MTQILLLSQPNAALWDALRLFNIGFGEFIGDNEQIWLVQKCSDCEDPRLFILVCKHLGLYTIDSIIRLSLQTSWMNYLWIIAGS